MLEVHREKFPKVKIMEDGPPAFSRRNHHFYVNKCGFKIWKLEEPKSDRGTYLLEKTM